MGEWKNARAAKDDKRSKVGLTAAELGHLLCYGW